MEKASERMAASLSKELAILSKGGSVSTRVSVREVEGGYFKLLACDKNIP